MTADLSPAVFRGLDAARRWALAQGSDHLEPVHVLLGLLDEEHGRAAALFEQAGLAREAVVQLFGQSAQLPEGEFPGLALSTLAEAVLREARRLASRMDANPTVTSEALVLAILQNDAKLRADLESSGLRMDLLDRAIAQLHGPLGTPLKMDEALNLENVTDLMDSIRLLDASANRAREALRVIEDYCRFIRNDALLTEQLKRMRHDLRHVLDELLAGAERVLARDTCGDVGTAISTAEERTRNSLTSVVEANLKRLQEALRSLEEFAKLSRPTLAARIEQLRYRCYTLEKNIVTGIQARERMADLRLYVLVSGGTCVAAVDWTISEAAAGGVQVFQLREKHLDDRDLLDRARRMRKWTRAVNACFIVNDRPDIARLSEADGVHLGQSDMSIHDARRILGPDAIIGVSTHSVEQLRQAVAEGPSYVAVGPTFNSRTKEFESLAGLDFVREAAALTDLPLFAIGGIDSSTIGKVLTAGVRRVAVGHAVCHADNPRQAANLIRAQIDSVWK
jgi:thiamine-phosphate pyrophosphorylase